MPWKYDSEKGFALQDQEKKFQTKSIIFSPSNPSAGDTVTITAWVENFSFVDNLTGVDMSFYFGNPNNGGSIITNIFNETMVTSAPIQARDRVKVNFDFVMPESAITSRVYGVLDPLSDLTEIHKNNNLGFNILGSANDSVGVGINQIYESHDYLKVYPNPAGKEVFIELTDGSFDENVQIQIIGLDGKQVRFVEKQNKFENVLQLDLSALKKGFYLVSVRSTHLNATRKILIE